MVFATPDQVRSRFATGMLNVPPPAPPATMGDVFAASQMVYNPIAKFISDPRTYFAHAPVPGFNPYEYLLENEQDPDGKYWIMQPNLFRDARSPIEVEMIKGEHVRYMEHREKRAGASFGLGLVSDLIAGISDPIGWFPVAGAFKKVKTVKQALAVGFGVGAASMATSEMLLHAQYPEMTFEESALNVTFGAMFFGLVSGAGKKINLRSQQMKTLRKDFEDQLSDISLMRDAERAYENSPNYNSPADLVDEYGLKNSPAPAKVEQQDLNPISSKISKAYFEHTGGKTEEWMRLSTLRQSLSNIPRDELDAVLKKMKRNDELLLLPFEDPQQKTKLDDAASLYEAGRQNHFIIFERMVD